MGKPSAALGVCLCKIDVTVWHQRRRLRMVKLVIVESPAKCGKIQGFLGDGYKVVATMGHIRALEESLDSVGIERGWEPTYVELSAKKDAIARLRAAAKGVEEVLLAADDDREGESIAWHTCFILRLNPATTRRIVFHEITRPALQAAVAAPRLLDMHKVNAQQARSMLDLLVGFTCSRTLWSHVAPKLSAGRCQTPALRLVIERDAEVDGHAATATWTVHGLACTTSDRAATAPPPLPIEAEPRTPLATEDDARALLEAMHDHTALTITHAVQSVSTNAPPRPLITSTLQQEASSLHGLPPKVTMQAAQKLYEAGHITYMRTDNAVLSEEAQTAMRACIVARWGEAYCASAAATPARRRTTAAAGVPAAGAPQAAHEAIRPTHPEQEDVGVTDSAQKTVYALIWRRAMQSQMAPARTDVFSVKCTSPHAPPGTLWTAHLAKLQFAGWKVLERMGDVAADAATWATWMPHLTVGATLHWTHLQADQVFSRPRGRYTEASLIADLEKRGIGRPSTFASLVGTLLDRGYVEKTNAEGRQQTTKHLQIAPAQWPPAETTQRHTVGADKNKLRATPLGNSVANFLCKEFADLFAYEFTARMEQRLDEIAQGAYAWKTLLQETWDTYKERYAAAIAGGAKASAAARTRILATGSDGQILKVIQSSKGPLFVRETPVAAAAAPAGGAGRRAPKAPKPKAEFAPLPSSVAFESATAADAERALAAAASAAAGELLGVHGGKEIRKKKGPYGFYADMEGIRVPLRKLDEPLAALVERLEAKAAAASAEGAGYERKIGDYTIKRGPYGLYMFKHTLKRQTFVKFPEALDPDKINAVDAAAAYSNGLVKKRHAPRKTTTGAKKDTE